MGAKLTIWAGIIVLFSSFIFMFFNKLGVFLCILIGFILFISGAIKAGKEIENNNEIIKNKTLKLLKSNEFIIDDIIFDLNNNSLSFSEKQEKICFIKENEVKEYYFSDILESRIEENGESIIKTSRSGQIGGALVGGLLAGGVGAAIGGLSSEKKNINMVNQLDLVIVVDDIKQPMQKLNLFKSATKNGVSQTDKKYMESKEQAEHWHSLISVFIRRADNNKSKTN